MGHRRMEQLPFSFARFLVKGNGCLALNCVFSLEQMVRFVSLSTTTMHATLTASGDQGAIKKARLSLSFQIPRKYETPG